MEHEDVFEEWSIYAKKKTLLARDIDLDAVVKNSESKIIAITGIRRSGKSSILMLLSQKLQAEGKKVEYVNLEDSRLKGSAEILDEISKWFGNEGFLLLDEITSAHDWDGWLSRNHEMLKGKVRLIISSSRSTVALPNKPLRGRILTYDIFPLSFTEFLRFKKIKQENTTIGKGRLDRALEEYIKYGGFPEVVLAEEHLDKIKIINSYFKDIIGLDVAEMSGQSLSIIEAFSKYVLQANYFSASKCLNFLKTLGYKIGKEKLLELESFSAASYLFFFVPIFSHSIKDRSQYPRKSYSGDLGFYYATSGKIDFGRAYETLVFLELKRSMDVGSEAYYWKNKAGFETDFVIRRGLNTAEVIQVAYELESVNTKDRELRGLIEINKELGMTKSTIITKSMNKTMKINGMRIRFVPVLDWLLEKQG
jgi:Predicted ATPase (AAA+ superfamily)